MKRGGPEKIDDRPSQIDAPPLPVKNDSSLKTDQMVPEIQPIQTCHVLKMDMSETIAYRAVCRTVHVIWHAITPYICIGWIDIMG